MKCMKCNVEMELKKTTFKYLGYEMYHELLRCPKCGLAYVPEDLAKGKIAQVEMALEDK